MTETDITDATGPPKFAVLGSNQLQWLRTIAARGGRWSAASGYAYASPARTLAVTESLERRGLLARGERADHLLPVPRGQRRKPVPEWTVTPAGYAALDRPTTRPRAAVALDAVRAAWADLHADPPRDPRGHLETAISALGGG